MRSGKDRLTEATRNATDRFVENAALVKRSLRHTARASAGRLEEAGEHVQDQVRYAAREADRYVRTHPLVVIGITVAVAAILIDLLRTRR